MEVTIDKLTGNPLLIEVKESVLETALQAKVNNPYKHSFLPERYSRTANRIINFTGTNYYVDSSRPDNSGDGLSWATAKKTISSLTETVPSGSIINLASGNYITNNETNGYLIFNRAGVRLKLKTTGNAIVECNASASYCVRIRLASETVFENIQFKTNQNHAAVLQDVATETGDTTFISCKLENTNNGGTAQLFKLASALENVTKRIEFINCTTNTLLSPVSGFYTEFSNENITWHFVGNTFNDANHQSLTFLTANSKCKINLYDNVFNMGSDNMICQIGNDTLLPTYNLGYVDVRNNKFNYSTGYGQHAFLLGRGVRSHYVVNNIITGNPISKSGLNLGIGLKARPLVVGDGIIEGNYVNSPRPIIFKGSCNCIVENNSFIDNEGSYSAVGFTNYKNGADEVLNTSNVFRFNNVIGVGKNWLLYKSNDTPSQSESDTIKTNTINSNKYYSGSALYLVDENSNSFNFQNKSNFWGANTNDTNSIEFTLYNIPIIY